MRLFLIFRLLGYRKYVRDIFNRSDVRLYIDIFIPRHNLSMEDGKYVRNAFNPCDSCLYINMFLSCYRLSSLRD